MLTTHHVLAFVVLAVTWGGGLWALWAYRMGRAGVNTALELGPGPLAEFFVADASAVTAVPAVRASEVPAVSVPPGTVASTVPATAVVWLPPAVVPVAVFVNVPPGDALAFAQSIDVQTMQMHGEHREPGQWAFHFHKPRNTRIQCRAMPVPSSIIPLQSHQIRNIP